ncbi:HRDC domain-containing protein [Paenibacillus piri]|uniref:Aldolase n=1 Tax=Paenibacillus piri TaxID=2547395 RepID=A0A4R5KZ80_9BACL|nr:HRDC domain-containing protein [Paenibacillus piri]TDG00478.1 aldolase [Paenibacillus piri]
MNLIFLNSLSRKAGEDLQLDAQVSISEQEGVWFANWREKSEDRSGWTEETWYKGTGWEDMLTAFRTRIFVKQREGFVPLLNAAMTSAVQLDGKSAQLQLLYYYSERHMNEELYEQLRQWRLKQAGLESKAPYLIATNRLLRMISTFLPYTPEELQQLPGMGANKIAAYGKELLALTQSCERASSFPLHWVEAEVDAAQFDAWLQNEKDRKQKAEQTKRDLKRTLLEAATRGDSLDALREQTQLQRRELLLLVEELDREGYDLEPLIEQALRDVSSELQELAWAAFELHGTRYLKPVLLSLYKQEELEGQEVDRIYEWLRLLRMKFRRANGGASQAEAG